MSDAYDKIIAAAKEAGKEDDLTSELLAAIFDYDNGRLLWKTPLNRRIAVGSIAGSTDGGGYVQVMINGKKYKAHRLIYKNVFW